MTVDLTALGWDAGWASLPYRRTGRRPGRVTRVDRGVCTVLGADGPVRATLGGAVLADAARDLTRLPCVGDWVLLGAWPDGRATIETVLPRRTALIRRTAGKDASGQVLAANLDTAAVVEPVHPEPDNGRIERLLALVHESGARPVVVLTKADLAADAATIARQLAEVAPGVPVLPVSAERGTGLGPLRPLVAAGRTLGLLGPSGAGKSSLVNALAGATVMPTQAIRRVDGKGRHTTGWRALVPVPRGGAVVDTPGVRAVGLLDGSAGLDRAFTDIAELATGCRYGDCAHEAEPACAVRAAVDSGELSVRRWESWRRLRGEVAFESGRRQARLAAERRGGWRNGRRRAPRPATPGGF
ncbi:MULTISPECIES: ribosome small subunit-dependent GTPase A [Micromonospora]|uniref:Small ribosomal subunit biogenesis GTPase RsgA n=1 Tax=Micromonospora yangpuensis TaxID=683228 RepID=A0A1C6UYU2_9ACTN|nr:ribosome small subunit-dependent GTPase A [Micromonospora yangpuensis]GGL95542.1 putative ribosome biogenesis GTPase RsgA [Micromonospora yangpuensis]SCL59179.1 ribosome biogenesis GTPase [Micromonospora yangpuensis]